MTKTKSGLMAATAICAILAVAGCKRAETPAGSSHGAAAPAGQAVTFRTLPVLGENMQAMPRLNGDGPAIAAINADMDRFDQDARANQCEGGGGLERGVTEPMTGPAYVSFAVSDGYYCEGAAHPSNDQSTPTYDLATGRRVDWVAAVPGLHLTAGDTTDMPASYVAPVSSKALSDWYSHRMLTDPVEGADKDWLNDCRESFAPDALTDTGFDIWLDAEHGGVTVSPEFAHVIQACAAPVTMTAEEMQRFGVSPALVQAVTAAHASGNWQPKDQ